MRVSRFYSRVVKYHKTNERGIGERASFMIQNNEGIITVYSALCKVFFVNCIQSY